ncbi:MAG: DEAD/DEAH box helicase [Halobacteriaceae archaeon]
MADGEGQTAFDALGPAVRAALEDRGFDRPTEPQRRAVPPIARGEDALVVAPTGTGKTETAMLPVLDALVDTDRFGIGALYVTPLRALNRDMRDRLEWWGETLGLDVDVRHGDTTDYQRRQQAENPPDVLVTTPETLQAMLTGERLREALADVGHVVVDEVHELAGDKRGAQLAIGLERLRALAGPSQRLGLSATVGAPEDVGAFLTGDRGCTVVEVDVGSRLSIEVLAPDVDDDARSLAGELMTTPAVASHVRAIRDQIGAHESTLVFVNTRQTAEALGSRFKELDVSVGVHHGSLSRDVRIDVEDRFKAGEIDALLCTSSMELGIDVGRVDHVVQYQSPREVARLVQRVGRAGHRADRVSRGTVVTSGGDDTLEALAIARRAEAGQVEPAAIHRGSLDTVANQVAGLVQSRDGVDARAALQLIRQAYPFRDLPAEQFRDVVRELHGNRVVYLDEAADRLETTGGTWQYVYANLSMIPDEETYEVHDIATGSQVGTLDERFVVTFAEPGATFIQRGEMWRVAEVDDEETRVEVSPVEDPAGEVPSWIGEAIPVPLAVAGEVGEMRGVAAQQLATGATAESVARDLAGRYPVGGATATRALETLTRHVEAAAPVPTDDRLVVERSGRDIVVNAAFGHRINETLGRLLAALLGQRTGSAVGMDTDPYRIELDVPSGVAAADVVELLEETDPGHVRPLVELSLKGSDALAFTLSQVAAKFGRLKRYRRSPGEAGRRRGMSPERLLEALEDTPVYDEAIRAVFHDDLDAEGAGDRLAAVQAGDIDVVVAEGRTPIGTDGRSGGQELLAPENADASVVRAVKRRLLEQDVRLVCTHCLEFDQQTKVRRVAEQPSCPHCDSTRIAALAPWADDAVTALRASDPDDEARSRAERAVRNANIVQSHGRKAVIALSARGVGPRNAARVINRHRETEAAFYRDILEREREYARTKSFWD